MLSFYLSLKPKQNKQVICPSCGAATAISDGPVHKYLESSPGCWAAFGEVLAREYSDYRYARNHQMTVDAYALQHPGKPSSQTIQSAAVHLASLCKIIENDYSNNDATEFLQKFASHKAQFFWLEPPSKPGEITVVEVLAGTDAKSHLAMVKRWALSTWEAWQQHHDQVKAWLANCE
ncbi:MAG TPA: hypothetical protein DCM64_01090 [Gammaproteobacteria bacterium]|jgi:hypothetical protein|nr:DUF5946 family protein [Gammaproteobacteria bacterium]MDP6733532.1 DUF5946 family protein [Gammaproteobacteria bacterium]HAJ75028.1 hypothetical protein [Gammaproteobacteria bacterium]|tara:strand:- start:598 stop:1128 length:531 start_codon:yes stop_codon:yes gene_type:complete